MILNISKMIITIPLFILEWAISNILAGVAWIFADVLARLVDAEGNLPKYLRWFQTVDATCYDEMWVAEHPTWTKLQIASSWIRRNPAYGFNYFARAWVNKNTAVSTFGNLDVADGLSGIQGWSLIISENGFFAFEWILRIPYTNSCIRGEYGWILKPLARNYNSSVLGALQVVLFFRFASFGVDNK